MLFKNMRLGKKGRPPLHPEREVNEVEKEVKQWAKEQAQKDDPMNKDDPQNLPDGRDDSSKGETSNAENSNIEDLYISWEADDSTHVSYDCFDGALKRLTPAGPVIRVHPLSTFSVSHDSSFGGELDQKRIEEAKRLQEEGRESPLPQPPSFEAKKEHRPTDTPAANSKTDIKWKEIEGEDEPAFRDKLESVSGMEPGLEITMGDSDSWHFFVHEASDQSIDKAEEEVNRIFHFCCAASLDQRSTASKSSSQNTKKGSDEGIEKKGEENDIASKTGTQDVKEESDEGIEKEDIEKEGEEGAGFFGCNVCCGVASDEDSGTTNSITMNSRVTNSSSLKSGSHETNSHEIGEGSVETQNEKVSVDRSKELTEPRCKNEHEKDNGGCDFCNHLQNESSSQVHKDSTVESKIVKKDEESTVLFGLFDAIFSPFFQSGTDGKQKQGLEQSNDKDCAAKTEDVLRDEETAVVAAAVSAAEDEEAAAVKAAVSAAAEAGKGLFGLLCGASVEKEVGCFVDGILCGGTTAVDKGSNKANDLQDSNEEASAVKAAVPAAAEAGKGLFGLLCGASVEKEVGCFVDGILCGGTTAVDKGSNKANDLQDSNEEASAVKAAVPAVAEAGKGLFGLLCGASIDKEVGCFVDGMLCDGTTTVGKDSNKANDLQDSKKSKADKGVCLFDWILCEGNKKSSSTPIDKEGEKDVQKSKEKGRTLLEKEKESTLQESKSEKKGKDLQESKGKDSTLQESKSEKKGDEAASLFDWLWRGDSAPAPTEKPSSTGGSGPVNNPPPSQIQNVDKDEKELKKSKESNDIVVPPKHTPKKSREDTIKSKSDKNLDKDDNVLKKPKGSNDIVVPPKPTPKKSREDTIKIKGGHNLEKEEKERKKPKESEDVVVPRKPTSKESREDTIKRKNDQQDMSADRTPPPRIQKQGREDKDLKTGKDTSIFKRVSSGPTTASTPGKKQYIKQVGYRRVGSIEKPKSGQSLWDGISQNMEDPLKILTFL